MIKEKRTWKFFSWYTFSVVIVSCILNAAIWIALHGIPLTGLPERKDVESVTIVRNGTEEREITDDEDVELLVKAANLLNYRFWGKKEGNSVIVVTYHLKSGADVTIEANSTTMWWKGKTHALKETDIFVNIIQGLFFDMEE